MLKEKIENNDFKNILYVINQLYKPISEQDLLENILDIKNKELLKEDYTHIFSKFNLKLNLIKSKEILNIDNLILPGIISYKKRKYVLLAITKKELILLDIINEKQFNISKKEKRKIDYIYVFTKEEERKILTKNKRWFYQILKEETALLTKISIISFFSTLFVLVLPLYIMSVYDRVIPNEGIESLYVLTIGTILFLLFNNIFTNIKNKYIEKTKANIGIKLEKIVLEKFLKINQEYDNTTMATKINIFKEMTNIKEYYIGLITNVILDFPTFVLGIILILILVPKLVIIPIGIFIIMIIYNLYTQKKIDLNFEKLSNFEKLKLDYLLDTLNSKKEILQSNNIHNTITKNTNIYIENEIILENINTIKNNFQTFLQSLLQLTTILFILFGSFLIMEMEMSIGYLIAIVILSNRMMTPLVSLNMTMLKYYDVQKSFELINNILKMPENSNEKKIIDLKDKITIYIKDLSFKYKKTNYVFNNLNLSVSNQEKIAIIGENGMGKTTLLKLITGQLTTTSGKIYINNFDIEDINKDNYLYNINLLNDKNYIFEGTMLDNINIGNRYSIEEIYNQLETQDLTCLINDNKEILNTPIKRDGTNISLGQIQLILLLRTFINESNLIILDEPLTNLNINNEQRFLKFLKNYIKDKTLILFTNEPEKYIEHNILNEIYRIENGNLKKLEKRKD